MHPIGRMLAMLKIWGRASSSNVQKVLWRCAELNIPFDRVDHGGPFGGNRDPDYLKLNPNGLVPTDIDGDLVIWESNTICRYLAATREGERLYPRDPAARTHVERWIIPGLDPAIHVDLRVKPRG
jgi:glutathione S-transferase